MQPFGQARGNDRAVTFCRIALITQQHHPTGQRPGELVEQFSARCEIDSKRGKESGSIPILSQPMSDWPRGTQGALMLVADPDRNQGCGKWTLGEPFPPRNREFPDVD